MKSNLGFALFLSLGMILGNNLFAQTWSDVAYEKNYDTVVVKGTCQHSIYNPIAIAVLGDTTSTGERKNPNRVYKTIPDNTYISDATCELDSTVPNLRIVAPLPEGGGMPPLHIRALKENGTFDKTFFQTEGSLYMQNQYFLLAIISDYHVLDREFLRAEGSNTRFEYDNCIFEFTNFCLFLCRAHHQTFKFTNCTFFNIGHEVSLQYGLVFNTLFPIDTLWFENNTILNHGVLSAAWTNFHVAPNFCYYNHNTILNGVQNPFLYYSHAEMIATNNLIINTGFVPDYPGFLDVNQDEDSLPKGIINVDTVEQAWINEQWPDSNYPYAEADRKILVDKNNVWWDPRFTDMFDSLPSFSLYPCLKNKQWLDQKIHMNTRTRAMFADDVAYPYFTEGTWYNIEPDFINNKDLVDEWTHFIIENLPVHMAAACCGIEMPMWRADMDARSILTVPDWPPLADLSYTNPALKSGGINKYPLGDLNWFPALKKQWDQTGEAEKLIEALKAGILPEDWAYPVGIRPIDKTSLQENNFISVYPNPLTDMINVKFVLSGCANVELIVNNITGQNVLSTNLGYQLAGSHYVTIDVDNLNPGIYILQIKTDNMAMAATKISVR